MSMQQHLMKTFNYIALYKNSPRSPMNSINTDTQSLDLRASLILKRVTPRKRIKGERAFQILQPGKP